MKASSLGIGFQGLVDDGLGVALWQADGSGPEPRAIGHSFTTPIETITAHYYIASRDYVDVTARGGLAATDFFGEWPRVRAAFMDVGSALENLTIRLPLTTAGADREGEDWFYRDGVETRHLRSQMPLPLLLDDQVLLEFAPPRLVLTEDYRGARRFADVRIALMSDPTPTTVAAKSLTAEMRVLIDAFVADLDGRPVQFIVDAIQLTSRTFDGQGRMSGRYAEIPAARIEVL